MKNSRATKAFTIMEILIVVVIVGIIATFAIPNYGNSVARTHLQDAIMQLSAIRTANQLYFARTSSYWPTATYTGTRNVNDINSNLSLNIIENSMIYTCNAYVSPTTFTCTATSTPAARSFTVTVTEAPLVTSTPPAVTDNPRCTAGTAPCPQ